MWSIHYFDSLWESKNPYHQSHYTTLDIWTQYQAHFIYGFRKHNSGKDNRKLHLNLSQTKRYNKDEIFNKFS